MLFVIFFRKNWLTAGDSSQDRDADDLGFTCHILKAEGKQLYNELSVVITFTSRPTDLFNGIKIPNVDVPKLVTQSQTNTNAFGAMKGFSTVVAIVGLSIFIASDGTATAVVTAIRQLFLGLTLQY